MSIGDRQATSRIEHPLLSGDMDYFRDRRLWGLTLELQRQVFRRRNR
jgi:hypothetical protein